MKRSVYLIPILIIGIVSFYQCKSNCPEQTEKTNEPADSISPGLIIADTITYDVIIKNADSTQVWQEQFLKHIDRSLLIDSIFAGVYSGRFTPYDFFSGKKMPLREVRKMEKEPWFTRNGIGKIQFTEIWYFNESRTSIEKKVYSIVLGVESFDTKGNLRGHKPVFKIYLNQN